MYFDLLCFDVNCYPQSQQQGIIQLIKQWYLAE
jgi:hypothetical protein